MERDDVVCAREEGAHTGGLLGLLEDRRTVDVTTMLRRRLQCEMLGGRQEAERHAVNLRIEKRGSGDQWSVPTERWTRIRLVGYDHDDDLSPQGDTDDQYSQG